MTPGVELIWLQILTELKCVCKSKNIHNMKIEFCIFLLNALKLSHLTLFFFFKGEEMYLDVCDFGCNDLRAGPAEAALATSSSILNSTSLACMAHVLNRP